jgi:protein-S-isoprenylcysteine O-methyltransferase Ste14
MWGVDWLWPSFRVHHALFFQLGVFLLVSGACIVLISAGLFRLRKTTVNPFGKPAVMVREGLYRFSRNPMYLGMLLALAGIGLGLGNLLALLLAPAFVAIMTRRYIVREEQLLEDRFGDEFRTYRRQVRRWI